MTDLEAAGYIIQDKQGNAIYGAGATVDEAWQQVIDGCAPFFDAYGNEIDEGEAFTRNFKTYGATAALLAKVEAEGGDIAWDIVRGVACTREQGEQS